jgi:hypothetical protein
MRAEGHAENGEFKIISKASRGLSLTWQDVKNAPSRRDPIWWLKRNQRLLDSSLRWNDGYGLVYHVFQHPLKRVTGPNPTASAELAASR